MSKPKTIIRAPAAQLRRPSFSASASPTFTPLSLPLPLGAMALLLPLSSPTFESWWRPNVLCSFPVRLCVCAESAEPGVYWRLRLWLGLPTHTGTRTQAPAAASIKKERIKASQQANAPPELPLKVSVPVAKSGQRRVGGAGAGAGAVIPSPLRFVVAVVAATLAARCSMLSAFSLLSRWYMCFLSSHTHQHTEEVLPLPTQRPRIISGDIRVRAFFRYSGVGPTAGWPTAGVDTSPCLAAVMLLW